MPLKNYGVLMGFPIERKLGLGGESPHYQIHMVDNEFDYRIAVNVKSQAHPSELKFLLIDDFRHPITDELRNLEPGFTGIESKPGGTALDYVRGNLFNADQMEVLPHDVPGPENDLNEKIDKYVKPAIEEPDAIIYAFGEPWGPENIKDRYFGFKPGNGIHDVHMNQGNVDSWLKDDGVWQDGGLVFYYPSIDKFSAVFLAFQSQSFHTDDKTGHRIDVDDKEKFENLIFIVSAMVNPVGDERAGENVTLLNVSDQEVDIGNWSIADKHKRKKIIESQVMKPGEFITVQLSGGKTQFSNKGGIITLLDKKGVKVHGVSYTRAQAKKEGWTILF
jgi:uncharacterized protein YukJ